MVRCESANPPTTSVYGMFAVNLGHVQSKRREINGAWTVCEQIQKCG